MEPRWAALLALTPIAPRRALYTHGAATSPERARIKTDWSHDLYRCFGSLAGLLQARYGLQLNIAAAQSGRSGVP